MNTKQNKIKLIIENKILDMIADDTTPIWKKPWLFNQNDTAYLGSPYRGINAVITALARTYYGFESHYWLTDSKINALNGKEWDEKKKRMVKKAYTEKFYYKKKNAKTIPIVFWGQTEKKDIHGNVILDENGEAETRPFLMYYLVHNASEICGLEDVVDEMEIKNPRISKIDALSSLELEKTILSNFENAPKVVHNSDKACYIPELDQINMPPVSSFESRNGYILTLLHELAHATGAKNRLNRPFFRLKPEDVEVTDRAKEELTAEFTSTFVQSYLNINESLDNSVAYIKDWNKFFKDNPGVLFDAISAADKATKMILGSFEEEVEEKLAI